MDNPRRASLAMLCGYLYGLCKNNSPSVYDFAQSKNISFSLNNNNGYVIIHDFDRKCDIAGSFPSYFDYGVSQYITLTKMGGNGFNVFDYKHSSYLMVTVNHGNISIFDYKDSQYYNYSIN